MAAVTVNSRYVNVAGSRRQMLFNVTGDNSTTLTTGLNNIQAVNVQLVATNPPSVAATTNAGGGLATVLFTAGGAFTADVEVIGN